MHIASYSNASAAYYIDKIGEYDTPASDVMVVNHILGMSDYHEYLHNMRKSVDQGYAYSLYKGHSRIGFFYGMIENNEYVGNSLYASDTIGGIVLTHFLASTSPKHKLVFYTHDNSINTFKSILTGESIRRHYLTNEPVVVKKDDVLKKTENVLRCYDMRIIYG